MAKLFHININSIRGKLTTLAHYVEQTDPDIILLNETRYKSNQPSCKIAGYYTICRHDDPVNGRGGTAIMVKDNIPAIPLNIEDHLLNLNCYVSAISLDLPNIGEIAIVSHYAPPSLNSIHNQLFTFFLEKFEKCIFLGDYNAKHPEIAPTIDSNAKGRALKTIISDNDLIVLNDVSQPTRYSTVINQNINPSVIDLAITSDPLNRHIQDCYTGQDLGSDHLPLHVHFKQHTQIKYPITKIRNLGITDGVAD